MPMGELLETAIPGGAKLTTEVSVPAGLISQTAPRAQPARGVAVLFWKVSSGLEKARFRLVYVPAGRVAVFRKADSVSSFRISIRTAPFPPSRSTFPGLSVAEATLTSKERIVTPAGGVSVMVIGTAKAPAEGEDDEDVEFVL